MLNKGELAQALELLEEANNHLQLAAIKQERLAVLLGRVGDKHSLALPDGCKTVELAKQSLLRVV
jgi:hypothetical protein